MAESVHAFDNHYVSLIFGLVLLTIGSWMVWDAYAGRGMEAPVPVKLISPVS